MLLAYADKFNLPIFFLRLLAYIYARHGNAREDAVLVDPGYKCLGHVWGKAENLYG